MTYAFRVELIKSYVVFLKNVVTARLNKAVIIIIGNFLKNQL
jgi:hypothetical protein